MHSLRQDIIRRTKRRVSKHVRNEKTRQRQNSNQYIFHMRLLSVQLLNKITGRRAF